MSETKLYHAEELSFEFTPNGSPFEGLLMVTTPEATFSAVVNLTKLRSRAAWAKGMSEDYDADVSRLKRALNEICTLRTEEVTAAARSEAAGDDAEPEDGPLSEEVRGLMESPGVLNRYVEDVARIRGVVRDRDALRLQCLVAFGAQLTPLPSGRPAGANLILTAEAGRGKNYICDAVATALPEEFYLAFESASAKSLFYRAENDPTILSFKWFYPNEAEGTDLLVETLRPVLSGGKASHLTVNKSPEGRNAAQELNIEGPVSITIPTVRNKLDGQLQTRMLVAELPDYEGRIAEHSRAVSRQLLPDHAGEDHGPRLRAWRSALRSLTATRRVVFPLDREEFCFDSNEVSHGARLWTNVLGLMLAHAWLEQRNREILKLSSGESVIVATPDDYEVAYDIFKSTCERSVVNLSDTHRAILDAVYDLKQQSSFTDGYSLRKIADAASVHHSTVAEHKTFLTRSVKLLREVEGGLDLVADALPSWWRKDDLLVGFPRPEQVRRWWEEINISSPKTARQPRHPTDEASNPYTYAEKSVGRPTRQAPDLTRQQGVSGKEPPVSDEAPDSVKPVNKPNTDGQGPLSGVSGGFGDKETLCSHEVPGGCWLCQREIDRLQREGMSEALARVEVLGEEAAL